MVELGTVAIAVGSAALGMFGPPARKAIGKLIGARADIKVAEMHAATQKIKNATAEEAAVSKALVKAAASRAVADPELVERTLERMLYTQLDRQENREAVARLALKYMEDHVAAGDANVAESATQPDDVDDDWLNAFGNYAENASTERVRDLWARVLAGKIRKPSSFSLSTLQILSVLDSNIALAFNRICGFLIEGRMIIADDHLKTGRGFEDVQELGAIGLLRPEFTSYTSMNFNTQPVVTLMYSDHVILLRGAGEMRLYVVFLTRQGRELASIIHAEDDVPRIKQNLDYLNKQGFTAEFAMSPGIRDYGRSQAQYY